MIANVQEAYLLLESLGAPNRLITHLKLVGEAAEEILAKLRSFQIDIQDDIVLLGVAVHDAGKIIHTNELNERGNLHEPAGEALLLEAGVQPEIARCCLSHARYDSMEVSFEELLVALSDKLWKGTREEKLELEVIDRVAEKLNKNRWDVYSELDECFEKIALKGDERLSRS